MQEGVSSRCPKAFLVLNPLPFVLRCKQLHKALSLLSLQSTAPEESESVRVTNENRSREISC